MRFDYDAAERFWRLVDLSSRDGCWLWMGVKLKSGYGKFRPVRGQRPHFAHRVAFAIAHGPIPDHMQVLHRCDTPACVRPDHLFLGTQSDNMRDMSAKGRAPHQGRANLLIHGALNGRHTKPERSARGESVNTAKLSADDVRAIRHTYAQGSVTMRALASQYGVYDTAISKIIHRLTWKHI